MESPESLDTTSVAVGTTCRWAQRQFACRRFAYVSRIRMSCMQILGDTVTEIVSFNASASWTKIDWGWDLAHGENSWDWSSKKLYKTCGVLLSPGAE